MRVVGRFISIENKIHSSHSQKFCGYSSPPRPRMNIVLQKTKNLPNEYSFVPPANEYSFVPSPGPNEKWFLGASLILKPAAGEKFFRCNISLCHWLVFLWGTHQFSIGVPIHFILAGTMRGKGVVRVLGSQISLSPLPHSRKSH